MSTLSNRLAEEFGNIDIYVFDQLLRGRIAPGMTVLDCGCGGGRNLVYLMRNGFDVRGVDQEPRAIEAIRALARDIAPALDAQNFRVEPVESMSFADASADVVLSSAVLHFARDEQHFHAMIREMWRVLRPGGMMFCRLASTIGMEGRFQNISERTYRLLDGSVRFLVDAELLLSTTAMLGGELIDPIKTTVVHEQRCMTTWVVRKAETNRNS
jgi:tellurite methyltransferase